MIIKKIISLIIFLALAGCGYESIYAKKDNKNFFLKEIKKLKNLKQSDLSEAKERLIGLRNISKEKSDSTMIDLLQEEIGGNAKDYYNYEEGISNVKLKCVRNLSKLRNFSFVALVPA